MLLEERPKRLATSRRSLPAGLQTHRRSGGARRPGTSARKFALGASYLPQPTQGCIRHVAEDLRLLLQMAPALDGDAIGLPPSGGFHGTDQSLLFQTGDGPIQGSGAEADVGESPNVLDNGVAVLVAARKAGQNKKGWIAHNYYATRNIA